MCEFALSEGNVFSLFVSESHYSLLEEGETLVDVRGLVLSPPLRRGLPKSLGSREVHEVQLGHGVTCRRLCSASCLV